MDKERGGCKFPCVINGALFWTPAGCVTSQQLVNIPSACKHPDCDNPRGCVAGACGDPLTKSLMQRFMSLLPASWRAAPPLKPVDAPPPEKAPPTRQRRLPGIPQPPVQTVDPGAPGFFFIPQAGCACQTWPGWVICPGCSHSTKCVCHSACIEVPASARNCGVSGTTP